MKLFPPLKAESQDLLHLDVLRLVASGAIVVAHFWHDLDLAPAVAVRWSRLDDLGIFVDVFFVISGIVIAWAYSARIESAYHYGRFLQKRAARLLPLHWATLAFYVVVGFVAAGYGEALSAGRYDGSCLLSNILLLHSADICPAPSYNTASWSISAEMFMYLLFPVFLGLQRNWRGSLAAIACAMIVGLFAFDGHLGPDRLWLDRTFDGGVLRAFPAFLAGMSAYACRRRLAAFHSWEPIALVAFVICVGGVILQAPKPVLLISAYLLAISAFGCDISRRQVSSLVRSIAPAGQLTYSLYMLHPVVGVIFIKVLGLMLLHLHGGLRDAWVVLAIPVSAVAAYLSFTWFEITARIWISSLRLISQARVIPSKS